MKQTTIPPTIKEQEIDINKEASALSGYSEGSLDRLDEESRIKNYWFKEKAVVWISIVVILSILFIGVGILLFSVDETTRDWGRQTLSALMGFAAGAIWQSSKS